MSLLLSKSCSGRARCVEDCACLVHMLPTLMQSINDFAGDGAQAANLNL